MRIELSGAVSGRAANPVSALQAEAAAVPAKQPRETADQGTEVSQERLEKMADGLNAALRPYGRSLQFEMTEYKRIVIKVVDNKTGDVIRQIPPDDLVRAFTKMAETLGLFMDVKR